jgi:hypothetical protein
MEVPEIHNIEFDLLEDNRKIIGLSRFERALDGKICKINELSQIFYATEQDAYFFRTPFEIDYKDESHMYNQYDICVSSPPFFTYEIYSTESTQSTSTYKTSDDWLYKFLIPSFKKIMKFLKPSNIFVHELPNGMKILKIGDFGISKHELDIILNTPTLGNNTTPVY